jgi:endonuclease G, mitochondrial
MLKSKILNLSLLAFVLTLFGCDKGKQTVSVTEEASLKNNKNIDDVLIDNSHRLTEFDANLFDFTPSSTTGAVIKRDSYIFSYNEKHEQSEWVAYVLTKDDVKYRKYERPYFVQDPMVTTGSADWRNYKNGPYNKGHLLPAADRRKSFSDYKETFYTSNISPQLPEFNSGIWNRLEEKVRYWATKYDSLYVVTGGVLEKNLPTIGHEQVSVPNYFYKVLMTKDASKMIAFLVPHEESDLPLYEFVTSVDSIEKITGIDFFEQLPKDIQDRMEKSVSYKEWSFE